MANITIGTTPLPPVQWDGDVSALLTLLASHLTGSLDQSVFTGQVGGTQPISNIGIWLNNNTLYNWSTPDNTYLPFPLVTGALFGGTLYTTQLLSSANAGNITLNLPNENGQTLATLQDLATPVLIVSASGSVNLSADWNAIGHEGRLYVNLTTNGNIVEANSPLEGQRYEIWVEQALAASGALTLSFPASWVLSAGAITLQTRSSATTRYIDHLSVFRVGSITFVEQEKGYTIPTSGGGSDTTPPVVNSIDVTSGTATIVLVTSKTLQGISPNTANWTVKKNGVANAVTGVSISGANINVTVTNTYGSSSNGTIQYTGSDIKDLAGNLLATFGPNSITIDSTGGGNQGGGGTGGGHLPP